MERQDRGLLKSKGKQCKRPDAGLHTWRCSALPWDTGKLDGIEAYHHSATPTQQQKLADIAKEHDLIVTGGSDFHGLYNETMTHIGSMTTDKENLDKLFKLIHINSQKANKAAVKTEK